MFRNPTRAQRFPVPRLQHGFEVFGFEGSDDRRLWETHMELQQFAEIAWNCHD